MDCVTFCKGDRYAAVASSLGVSSSIVFKVLNAYSEVLLELAQWGYSLRVGSLFCLCPITPDTDVKPVCKWVNGGRVAYKVSEKAGVGYIITEGILDCYNRLNLKDLYMNTSVCYYGVASLFPIFAYGKLMNVRLVKSRNLVFHSRAKLNPCLRTVTRNNMKAAALPVAFSEDVSTPKQGGTV